MNGLRTGPIKDVALGIYDGPHATPKEADAGPVFLGIKNITPEGTMDLSDIRHISEEDYPKWTKRVVPRKDDIVFSYEATLHRYAIIPDGFRGCLGRRMALIRPDKTKVNPGFLHYYFMTSAWRAVVESNIISGATVDRIPLTKFPEFELCLPDLDVQHRIASVLSAYDDLIENNRHRIQLLERAARLLYREWFVHLRFPGHEHTRITRGAPKEWEKKTLGDISSIIMGQSPKSIYYNKNGVGLPFHQGVANFGERFPSHQMYCTALNRLAESGDILFSVRAPVGRINIAPDKIVIGRGISAIRSNQDQQNFLFYALKSYFFKEDMIGGGTIFSSITKKDLQQVELMQPSDEIVNKFILLVNPIDQQIRNLQRMIDRLTQSRDVVLHCLMNGKIIL